MNWTKLIADEPSIRANLRLIADQIDEAHDAKTEGHEATARQAIAEAHAIAWDLVKAFAEILDTDERKETTWKEKKKTQR